MNSIKALLAYSQRTRKGLSKQAIRRLFNSNEIADLRRGKCLHCRSYNLEGDDYYGEHLVWCPVRWGYGCGMSFIIPPLRKV